MKQVIFIGVCLLLTFASCKRSQDAEALLPQAEYSDDEYVTVTLSIGGEQAMRASVQDMRAFFHLSHQAGHENWVRFTFGTRDSKVNVRTQIYSIEENERGVRNSFQIFNEVLPWTVVGDNLNKLRFADKIKISKRALANAKRLILYATVQSNEGVDGDSFYTSPLREITTTQNLINLDIPYVLRVDLNPVTTKAGELRVKDGQNPLFHPLGQILLIRIYYNGQAPISCMGVGGSALKGQKILRYAIPTLGDFDKPSEAKLEHPITDDLTPISGSFMGTKVPKIWTNKRRVMSEAELEPIVIRPGEVLRMIAWSPDFRKDLSLVNFNLFFKESFFASEEEVLWSNEELVRTVVSVTDLAEELHIVAAGEEFHFL